MSTSDPIKDAIALTDELDLSGALAAAAAGAPDPGLLERMARELLGSSATTQASVDELSLPRLPSLPRSIPSTASIPDSSQINDLQPTGDVLPRSTITTIPGITTMPGGVAAGGFSANPEFSFLQDARSLFASPPAAPIHAVPFEAPLPVKMPAETQLRHVSQFLPGSAAPKILVSIPSVTSPQISGAPSSVSTLPGTSPESFLSSLRSISSIEVSPTLEPAGVAIPQQSSLQSLSSSGFDVNSIRRDFPILQEKVNGRQLIWLDNAATTQKPQSVIDRLSYFYAHENSNIHRAAHTLAARATDAYEAAREKTRRFLNASSVNEVIFVRGATEAINLVAKSWGARNIQKDDEIVITRLEHHANIVPWQMLCAEKGAKLKVAPVDDSGQILLDEYEKLLGPRTRLVSIAHVSNALGTVTPVKEMTEAARRHGAKVLVDGAQAVSHMRVDVQAIDCDFYVFSGHKVFAPTGIGVVFGKSSVLENTPPWQGGGNMIADVTIEKTIYQPPPNRFEAGTGSIADAVGLGAAIDYLDRIGIENVARYEHDLLVYAISQLQRIPGLHLIGTAKEKASVLSFVLDGFRTEDVGAALNREGIAVRSGHHCAQPILRRFGQESTVRTSLAVYNTCEEIDALVAAIWNIKSGRSPGLH